MKLSHKPGSDNPYYTRMPPLTRRYKSQSFRSGADLFFGLSQGDRLQLLSFPVL
jgi:hypothetical protein